MGEMGSAMTINKNAPPPTLMPPSSSEPRNEAMPRSPEGGQSSHQATYRPGQHSFGRRFSRARIPDFQRHLIAQAGGLFENPADGQASPTGPSNSRPGELWQSASGATGATPVEWAARSSSSCFAAFDCGLAATRQTFHDIGNGLLKSLRDNPDYNSLNAIICGSGVRFIHGALHGARHLIGMKIALPNVQARPMV